MARPSLRIVIAAVIAACTVLVGAPTTAADEDEPVVYSGSRTAVVYTPEGVPVESTSEERTIELRCTDGVCDVSGLSLANQDGIVIQLVDGRANYSFPATGTACDDPTTRAVEAEFVATATAFTGTMIVSPQGQTPCGDGTTKSRTGTTYTYELPLVSGDPCALDGSCTAALEPEPTPSATASPVIDPDTTVVTANRGPSDPTVLSTLTTAGEAATVRGFAWAVIGAIILVLLVAFPTHLANNAIDTVTGRWAERAAKRRGGAGAPRSLVLRGLPAALGGVVAAALISAFVDPAFGLDAASLRMLGSLVVGLLVDVALGWMLVIAVIKRTHPSSTVSFEFRPLTLLIVIAAVVVTRVTGFEPGIVFGLVAGVVFGGILATAEKAKAALVTLGCGFAAALIAWLAYSGIVMAGSAEPFVVFVQETLSAVAIAGIVALPIALLPLRGLAGHTVWEWKRPVWGLAYGVGLGAFLLVLLPMPFSWDRVGLDLMMWIGLYVLYAIGSFALWLIVERPWRRG